LIAPIVATSKDMDTRELGLAIHRRHFDSEDGPIPARIATNGLRG
jgi:hypothetical protein